MSAEFVQQSAETNSHSTETVDQQNKTGASTSMNILAEILIKKFGPGGSVSLICHMAKQLLDQGQLKSDVRDIDSYLSLLDGIQKRAGINDSDARHSLKLVN